MSQLLHLTGKSIGNIAGRPLSVTTSLISMLLLFIMISLVWISSLSSENYFDNLSANINMEVFLDDVLPDSLLIPLFNAVNKMDGVRYTVYISKEDAREKLFSLMGTDLLEGLEGNPLPRSMILEFDKKYIKSEYLRKLSEDLSKISGTSEIHYASQWLEKAEKSRSLIKKAALFLGIAIGLAIVLNLLHAVRLSVRARHEELFQLQLLGAGTGFLSIPYIVEGFFYTAVSSVAAWVLVYYGSERLSFHNIEIIFPLQIEVIYFCMAAALTGMVTGYVCIRRSL